MLEQTDFDAKTIERDGFMILHAYTPEWSAEFRLLKVVYLQCLGDSAIGIEHVGSTSIPEIQAKPIIDIDIVMKDYGVFPEVVEKLVRLGYSHNGDQGILHREAFKRMDEYTPHIQPQRHWLKHHLYVCPEFSKELKRHIIFRDYLRRNACARNEYERIKGEIAAKSAGDQKTYAAIKEVECTDFVEKTLTAAMNENKSNAVDSTSK